MAQTVLASSASLRPFDSHFSGGRRQWSKLFPGLSRRFSLSSIPSSRRKGLVFSSPRARNGGVPNISESDKAPRVFTWSDTKRPKVCILGGGFGGLYTALRLESLVWPDDKKPQICPGDFVLLGSKVHVKVILVDQSEHFVFKPMLYELLSGEVDSWEIAPRFSDLLANTGILFLQDKVKLLEPTDHLVSKGLSSGGTVHLESGVLIEYDWLVLALGAEPKLDFVPGAAKFALPFSTLEDARNVDSKLKSLERKYFGKESLIRVVVVGCGYAGVELAATLSERLRERGLVQAVNAEKTICPTAPSGNREAALKVLSSRKVQLLLGYVVRSIQRVGKSETSEEQSTVEVGCAIETDKISEKYLLDLQPTERGLQKQILEADLVLWTVGTQSLLPGLEPNDKPPELPLNARGQAETDETLRVKGHPRIFALGDSSALRDSSGKILPGTAQVAFQQADFAAWNLWAAINGRPLLPFRFQNLGEMITLGRNDAAISPSFIDGLTLEGPIGHTARKLAYLMRLPTDEHRLKVGISWLAKSAIDSIASVQSAVANALSGS